MIKHLGIILILGGCGHDNEPDTRTGRGDTDNSQTNSNGSSCTVSETETGAKIICPDGSVAEVRHGIQGPAGSAGAPGEQGPEGARGSDGGSCRVQSVSNGALVSCPDGSSVVILNGVDGKDGEDGAPAVPTAYTIVDVIDPCGPQGAQDEVLLRMANGKLLAHYSHGSKQFLAILDPGQYITTDGTSCRFTVDSNNQVRW